jgi:hypothetical protein
VSNLRLLKQLAILALGVGALLLLTGIITVALLPIPGVAVLMLGAMAVQIGLGVLLFHNLRAHIDIVDRQVRAVWSAVSLSRVELNRPVFFHRHAAAPDFIEIVAEVIRRQKVSRVLELGSGTTSLYMAMLLPSSRQGGRLVCLEDSVEWVKLIQSEIAILPPECRAWAEVIHAPLVSKRAGELPFYALESAGLERYAPFDLLIVDGPWDVRLRQAAWPRLKHLLSPSATLILDDGDQPVVGQTVQGWLAQEPTWQKSYYPTVKGTWVIRMESGNEHLWL